MLSCILVEPESPGNIGSIARVMQNFDVDGPLILVNPCKITNETYMMACNATEVIDNSVTVDTYEQARQLVDVSVATSKEAGDQYNVRRIAITPQQLSENMGKDQNVGIVLGRESSGLTNSEIAASDLVVTIPSSERYPTLNISHAAAIVFYELFKHAPQCPAISLDPAMGGEQRMLFEDYGSIIDLIEHREYRKRNAKVVFRHVVSRSFMSSREAYTLKGVFRKILRRISEQ